MNDGLFPEHFEIPKDLTQHHKAQGCSKCYHTGYSGRKAIYEIIPITAELTEKIKANVLEINSYLKAKNIRTLKENALDLVKEGLTSIDEIYALLID